ncbi:hypothetical protein ACLBOM_07845 [Escherichia coli]
MVTRGAGTGLSGGGAAAGKRCVVVMARFKEILDINPVGLLRARAARRCVTWRSPRPLHRIKTPLRTGPFLTNRLFHWRQRGRNAASTA